MRRFWDERSRENAWFFVDDTLAYDDPDRERFWARGEQVVDDVLEALGVVVGPSDVVVDVGCGVGRVTRPLAARCAHVHALDASAEMLQRARELNPHLANVTWHHTDGTSLKPLGDRTADGIFSWVVFQHIPDPRITLGYVEEMARVLRTGGWAAFQISNDPAIHHPRGARERLGQTLAGLLARRPRGRHHPAWRGSAVDLDDLRAVARDRDLVVERVIGEGTQFCLVRLRRSRRGPVALRQGSRNRRTSAPDSP